VSGNVGKLSAREFEVDQSVTLPGQKEVIECRVEVFLLMGDIVLGS